MSEFTEWVTAELARRGWTQNELGRRGNISKGMLSPVMSGKRKPGVKFCFGVARAFGMLPDEILTKAGLPPLDWKDPSTQNELTTYASYLSEKNLEMLLEIAKLMLKAQGIEVLPSQEESEE